jgi:two-component system, chemotaxis family, chemotaxis protein CheY
MNILIVDDAGVMRKVIIKELINMGIQVENIFEACDGKEGFEKAKSLSLDLILMDWNMPNMLGIDAVIAIREAGIQTPIMMITTESERTNIIKAIQAGANNYLTKPFNKQDFQTKIQQILGDQLDKEQEPTVEKSTVINAGQGKISMS